MKLMKKAFFLAVSDFWRFFKAAAVVAAAILIIWFLASWFDTAGKSLPMREMYRAFADWNLFVR